mgnify:CR=1 FL=1
MCPDCESKMSLKNIFIVLTLVVASVFVFDRYASASNSENKNEVIVYKNADCGCCSKWAEHLRENGFKVVEKAVDNLDEIKNSLGVPKGKRSCHTAVLGKYIFEGHIPAKSIKKFLKDGKNLKGLVVPDMPMGSPGMDYGSHKAHFTVMSFDENGKTSTFEKL